MAKQVEGICEQIFISDPTTCGNIPLNSVHSTIIPSGQFWLIHHIAIRCPIDWASDRTPAYVTFWNINPSELLNAPTLNPYDSSLLDCAVWSGNPKRAPNSLCAFYQGAARPMIPELRMFFAQHTNINMVADPDAPVVDLFISIWVHYTVWKYGPK